MKPRPADIIGGVALAIACWFIGCNHAHATQRYVAKQVVQPVYSTPAYYQVGAQVQQQAVATQAFRQSDEYLEYLELRGFARGVEAARAAATVQPGTPQAVDSDKGDEPEPPAEAPPAPSNFAARYPILAATCTRCHGGKDPDNPDGGLFLDGTVDLSPGDTTYEKLGRIATAVVNGRMPKNHAPLAPQEEYDFLVQLFSEAPE